MVAKMKIRQILAYSNQPGCEVSMNINVNVIVMKKRETLAAYVTAIAVTDAVCTTSKEYPMITITSQGQPLW
jgi:hypothetical protein